MKVSKFIPKVITRQVGRQILAAKKNSPHIFFGVGVVGVIGSTVLACKATLELADVLDDIRDDVDAVKAMAENPERYPELKHEPNLNRDLVYVYGKGTARIVKLYAPSVIIGGLSIAALTGSHVALTRRNTALTAAYAGLSQAYDAYRERVKDELGEERELDIYHSARTDSEKDENGKVQKIKTADPNTWSPYARFFDEASPNWQKNGEMNHLFVKCQQNYANHLLQARGHVFLNEVYDMLGIPRSQAGQVVGWVIGKDSEGHKGDNYIDFGMYQARNARFLEGWEKNILLDFNVDGVIYDKI